MKLTIAAAVAVACGVMLSGCVSGSSYPDGEAADIEGERQRILDLTWQSLELSGVERPTPEVIRLGDDEDWSNAYFECASRVLGTANLSFGFGGDTGYELDAGSEPDDATLVALYTCVAELPLEPFARLSALSPQQIDYVYDYYQSWLIPCLATRDIAVIEVPTRSQFTEAGGQWDPYGSIALGNVSAVAEAQEHCGISPAQQQLMDALNPDAEED